jgi:predicted nucleic acid-binding protein
LRHNWVVDASVVVKLYLREELSDVTEALFEAPGMQSFFVPDIFYSECANIFWKNVRRLNIQSAHAQSSLHSLMDLIVFPVSSTELLHDTLDLALEYGITAYDASYVALSEKLRIPFVTADRKLIGNLKGTGTNVHWLGDLPA